MPSTAALRRASSKSSLPQQLFACAGLRRRVHLHRDADDVVPAFEQKPAATAESTPPLIAAITRSLTIEYGQDNTKAGPTQTSPMSDAGPANAGRAVSRRARGARALALSTRPSRSGFARSTSRPSRRRTGTRSARRSTFAASCARTRAYLGARSGGGRRRLQPHAPEPPAPRRPRRAGRPSGRRRPGGAASCSGSRRRSPSLLVAFVVYNELTMRRRQSRRRAGDARSPTFGPRRRLPPRSSPAPGRDPSARRRGAGQLAGLGPLGSLVAAGHR